AYVSGDLAPDGHDDESKELPPPAESSSSQSDDEYLDTILD
ncbi:unnamed protein product, partial [marine sediment metagenome]